MVWIAFGDVFFPEGNQYSSICGWMFPKMYYGDKSTTSTKMCAWHFSVPFNKRDGEKVSDPFQGKIGMLSDLQITWRFFFQPEKKKLFPTTHHQPTNPPTHQANHHYYHHFRLSTSIGRTSRITLDGTQVFTESDKSIGKFPTPKKN